MDLRLNGLILIPISLVSIAYKVRDWFPIKVVVSIPRCIAIYIRLASIPNCEVNSGIRGMK